MPSIDDVHKRGRVTLNPESGSVQVFADIKYAKRKWSSTDPSKTDPPAAVYEQPAEVEPVVKDIVELVGACAGAVQVVWRYARRPQDASKGADYHKWRTDLESSRAKLIMTTLASKGVPANILSNTAEEADEQSLHVQFTSPVGRTAKSQAQLAAGAAPISQKGRVLFEAGKLRATVVGELKWQPKKFSKKGADPPVAGFEDAAAAEPIFQDLLAAIELINTVRVLVTMAHEKQSGSKPAKEAWIANLAASKAKLFASKLTGMGLPTGQVQSKWDLIDSPPPGGLSLLFYLGAADKVETKPPEMPQQQLPIVQEVPPLPPPPEAPAPSGSEPRSGPPSPVTGKVLMKGGMRVKRKRGSVEARFFVLYPDRLDYYKTEADFVPGAEPRGCVDLRDIAEVSLAADGALILAMEKQNLELLGAKDGDDMTPWKNAVERALDRVRGGGTPRSAEKSPSKATVLCEGLLKVERKGDSVTRFFVLEEKRLAYYESMDDRDTGKPSRGQVSIEDVSKFEEKSQGFVISFRLPESERQPKPLVVSTVSNSAKDQNMWVTAMEKLLGKRLGDSFTRHKTTPRPGSGSVSAVHKTVSMPKKVSPDGIGKGTAKKIANSMLKRIYKQICFAPPRQAKKAVAKSAGRVTPATRRLTKNVLKSVYKKVAYNPKKMLRKEPAASGNSPRAAQAKGGKGGKGTKHWPWVDAPAAMGVAQKVGGRGNLRFDAAKGVAEVLVPSSRHNNLDAVGILWKDMELIMGTFSKQLEVVCSITDVERTAAGRSKKGDSKLDKWKFAWATSKAALVVSTLEGIGVPKACIHPKTDDAPPRGTPELMFRLVGGCDLTASCKSILADSFAAINKRGRVVFDPDSGVIRTKTKLEFKPRHFKSPKPDDPTAELNNPNLALEVLKDVRDFWNIFVVRATLVGQSPPEALAHSLERSGCPPGLLVTQSSESSAIDACSAIFQTGGEVPRVASSAPSPAAARTPPPRALCSGTFATRVGGQATTKFFTLTQDRLSYSDTGNEAEGSLLTADIRDVEVLDNGLTISFSGSQEVLMKDVGDPGTDLQAWITALGNICSEKADSGGPVTPKKTLTFHFQDDHAHCEPMDMDDLGQENPDSPSVELLLPLGLPALKVLESSFEDKLREIFQRCDRAGTGYITKANLVEVCRSSPLAADLFGLSEAELGMKQQGAAFAAILKNGPSTKISWEEFLAAYTDGQDGVADAMGGPGLGSPGAIPDEVPLYEGTLLLLGAVEELKYFRMFRGRIESYKDACEASRATESRRASPSCIYSEDVQGIWVNDSGFRIALPNETLELKVPTSDMIETRRGAPRTLLFNAETGRMTCKDDISYEKKVFGKTPQTRDEPVATFSSEKLALETLREVAALYKLYQVPLTIYTSQMVSKSSATGSPTSGTARMRSSSQGSLMSSEAPGPMETWMKNLAKNRCELCKKELMNFGVPEAMIRTKLVPEQVENQYFVLDVKYKHVDYNGSTGEIVLKTNLHFQKRLWSPKKRDDPTAELMQPQVVYSVLAEVAKICLMYHKPVAIVRSKNKYLQQANPFNDDHEVWLDKLSAARAERIKEELSKQGVPERLLIVQVDSTETLGAGIFAKDADQIFRIDLGAMTESDASMQDLLQLWSRALQAFVGQPEAEPSPRKMVRTGTLYKPSQSMMKRTTTTTSTKSQQDQCPACRSGFNFGEEMCARCGTRRPGSGVPPSTVGWEPSPAFMQELGSPLLRDWLDGMSNRPLCQGIVGVAEKGTLVARYALLYRDRIEAFAKPLDAVHGKKPQISKAVSEMKGYETAGTGLLMHLGPKSLAFHTRSLAEVQVWTKALIPLFGDPEKSPRGARGELIHGSDTEKRSASAPRMMTRDRHVWEAVPERHRPQSKPPARRLSFMSQRALGLPKSPFPGEKPNNFWVNTHKNGREARSLIHGPHSDILMHHDRPGGERVFAHLELKPAMATRDPTVQVGGSGDDSGAGKLTGHRHDFRKTTPRGDGPGDCSWLKVTHVNHVSPEAPAFTPRRAASNAVAGKVVEGGGPILRSPNTASGRCKGTESAPVTIRLNATN